MAENLINIDFTDYLGVNEAVEFVKEHSNNKFFSENSLFDCVIMKKIKPIIFFDGYCLSTPNQDYCCNPQDFEKLKNREIELENDYISLFQSQIDIVQGYFYINSINNKVTSFDDDIEFRNTDIHKLTQYVGSFRNLAVNGFSDKMMRCYFYTPIQYCNFLMLADDFINHIDELGFIKVSKKDLRFSIKDLIKITDFYIIKNDEIESIMRNYSDLFYSNQELKKENELLRVENENIKSVIVDTKVDNRELPPNSQKAVAKLLYALLKEHNYELGARKGATNTTLEELTKKHKVGIHRDTIAIWLDRVNALEK